MKITRYSLSSAKLHAPVKIAVVADLHDVYSEALIRAIRAEKPTLVAVPGDVVHNKDRADDGLRFLSEISDIPTFVSLGNHEWRVQDICRRLEKTGARLLDDDFLPFGDLLIGGLSSGVREIAQGRFKRTPDPETAWMDGFSEADGFRLLLCHHPEYYPRLLRDKNIDLILSGHAHGGQWRPFGIAVFAPGQGLFPRYTGGIHDGKLLISRGLANHVPIPRLWNPPELVMVEINP